MSYTNPPAAIGAGYIEAPMGEELDWADEAACRDMESWIFFPPERSNASTTRWAKRVCAGCPVRIACQDWALTRHEEFGVWGGLTEGERREIWSGKRKRPA
jgi:WhiB family redox-sensing transcriptional regulator